MSERKSYGRYYFIRGHQSLWKGDPSLSGSRFREVVITSNQWNSTAGVFQVYAIECQSLGMLDATLDVSPAPQLLFDADFDGLAVAAKQFAELANSAKADGYSVLSLFDELDFQSPAPRRIN